MDKHPDVTDEPSACKPESTAKAEHTASPTPMAKRKRGADGPSVQSDSSKNTLRPFSRATSAASDNPTPPKKRAVETAQGVKIKMEPAEAETEGETQFAGYYAGFNSPSAETEPDTISHDDKGDASVDAPVTDSNREFSTA